MSRWEMTTVVQVRNLGICNCFIFSLPTSRVWLRCETRKNTLILSVNLRHRYEVREVKLYKKFPDWSQEQRATLHPWPQVLKFTPRGELGPQGWNLSPRGNVHPFVQPQGVNTLYSLPRRMEGQTENFIPRGSPSPLGNNFAPGVKVST
jgi:hypothetical protein